MTGRSSHLAKTSQAPPLRDEIPTNCSPDAKVRRKTGSSTSYRARIHKDQRVVIIVFEHFQTMESVQSKIQAAIPRNQELLQVLADTDYAPPALEQQTRYIADVENEIKQLDSKIKELEEKRKKELKDHEKYRDSVMKRFAYKVSRKEAKFNEKASKEEKEYFDVLQEEHKSKEIRKNSEINLTEARNAKQELEKAASRHKKAQQDLDDLYDSIFEGPTPGFPEEDSKEQAAHDALNQYHDMRVRVESESQVLTLLGNAGSKMKLSQAFLQEARQYSQWDMFGGGAMSDMMERSALNKAEITCREAQMAVDQARRLSPEVHPMPPVNIAQGNLMSDVFFDNIFTDMAFHEKIKASQAEQVVAHRDLDSQFINAKQRLESSKQQLKQLANTLEISRVALQQTRSEAFARV